MSAALQNLRKLWRNCRLVGCGFTPVLLRHVGFKLRGRNLLTGNRVSLRGLANLHTQGLLSVALSYVGFMSRHDRTWLNIQGSVQVLGNFSIGRGCRLDIGRDAQVVLGSGYINANTQLIIMHSLKIGHGCAISWGCQFLDEDFHILSYPGKPQQREPGIVIGDHVWIGTNVTVLKGAWIPDGSVVAAGSVVTARFTEKNTLIAGNPAKVIRRDISWQ